METTCVYRAPTFLLGNILIDTAVWRVFNMVLARPKDSGPHFEAWQIWGCLECVSTSECH